MITERARRQIPARLCATMLLARLTDGDVLLDVEVAGVEESPESPLIGLRQDLSPSLAENEGNDLHAK